MLLLALVWFHGGLQEGSVVALEAVCPLDQLYSHDCCHFGVVSAWLNALIVSRFVYMRLYKHNVNMKSH